MTQVLIVDDDLGTREGFSIALRACGHSVFTAASAAEGLELSERVRPDVALADLRLPDCDGLSVLSSLRRISPRTTVVVVTGFGTTRSAVSAIQLGAVDYLEKPVWVDQLVETVGGRLRPRSGL